MYEIWGAIKYTPGYTAHLTFSKSSDMPLWIWSETKELVWGIEVFFESER